MQVESYAEKDNHSEHDNRKRYEPNIPLPFRAALINAIRDVHSELLQPPERIASNADRLKQWVPPVKKAIDWDALLQAAGSRVGTAVGGAMVPRSKSPEGSDQDETAAIHEPSHLTIGLIGWVLS